LVSTEFTPPPRLQRRVPHELVELESVTHEVNKNDLLFSTPPPTNARPVAISVREPAGRTAAPEASLRPWFGIMAGSLTAGFLAASAYFAQPGSALEGEPPAAAVASPVVGSAPAVQLVAYSSHQADFEPSPWDDDMSTTASAEPAAPSPLVPPSAASVPRLAPPPASPAVKSPFVTTAPAPRQTPTLGSGDVLIVSATPGVNVYLGHKFIGQTPVRTRLPVGPAQLSAQVGLQGPRTPIVTRVASGRLNIVSLR
jgi:hypothetical protein